MIRDRKMYVAPTPFGLTSGTAHNQTLILPIGAAVDARFVEVGRLARREAEKLIVGYRGGNGQVASKSLLFAR
jgi:hypothetical protein